MSRYEAKVQVGCRAWALASGLGEICRNHAGSLGHELHDLNSI